MSGAAIVSYNVQTRRRWLLYPRSSPEYIRGFPNIGVRAALFCITAKTIQSPEAGITNETVAFPLDRANAALGDLRKGARQGAAVLVP